MLNFEFWKFSKRKDSTKRPSTSGTIISVNLKHPTSEEEPTLTIQGFNTDFNYCKGLGNYYFVREITYINNDIVEVSLTKDRLATYKTDIGNYTAFVNRSDSDYDVNLIDNEMSCRQLVKNVQTKTVNINEVFDGVGCYIMRVVSDSSNSVSGVKTYILSKNEVMHVLSFMFSDNVFDAAWDSVVKATFNPFQYILSLKFCALSYSVMTANCPTEQVKFGWWQDSTVSYHVCNYVGKKITFGMNAPTRYFNDFRDYTPNYSNYQLLLPSSGLYEIPSADMYFDSYDLQLYFDALTGKGTWYMLVADSQALLHKFSAQVMADVQISQMSTNLSNIVGSAAGAVGGIASGNYVVAGASIGNAISNLLQPSPSSKGSTDTIMEMVSIRALAMYVKHYDAVDTHPIGFGRPLNQNRLISSLSGYVKCSGASIELDARLDDITAINDFLNSGFYYE